VFDAEKSARNLIKHGIDFQQAQEMWNDSDRVEVRVLSAIITYRAEIVRVISVRRARREEIERYES
jgi:uncharacterized DUF497 family protein